MSAQRFKTYVTVGWHEVMVISEVVKTVEVTSMSPVLDDAPTAAALDVAFRARR